jgi:hypothetical protein
MTRLTVEWPTRSSSLSCVSSLALPHSHFSKALVKRRFPTNVLNFWKPARSLQMVRQQSKPKKYEYQ